MLACAFFLYLFLFLFSIQLLSVLMHSSNAEGRREAKLVDYSQERKEKQMNKMYLVFGVGRLKSALSPRGEFFKIFQ